MPLVNIQRLVATLGSRSNLKRVNRKAILDVDVPKTCEIIITPEVPMALRLQSNLLWIFPNIPICLCVLIGVLKVWCISRLLPAVYIHLVGRADSP